MQNPWLNIPVSDYEAHMSASNVKQHFFLNTIFKKLLSEYMPENIIVPGCTTGNGFEHIDFQVTTHVVGIDINEEYLRTARSRFSDERIEFINSDICSVDLGSEIFKLIHCALIFEYVQPERCLDNLIKHLAPDGSLSVVLQLPSENHAMVSKTNFKSLESLNSIIKLVNPNEFKKIATELGLFEHGSEIITLESGKSFYFGVYKKSEII